MVTINLRDHYPTIYAQDYFIQVDDNVAAMMDEFQRKEKSDLRQIQRHKAFYSLDAGYGISEIELSVSMYPEEEEKIKYLGGQALQALDQLPALQAMRIYAHVVLNISVADIANMEGVNRVTVSRSIKNGLTQMKKILFF